MSRPYKSLRFHNSRAECSNGDRNEYTVVLDSSRLRSLLEQVLTPDNTSRCGQIKSAWWIVIYM